MPPKEENQTESFNEQAAKPKRRILFPWVILLLYLLVWIITEVIDVDTEIQAIYRLLVTMVAPFFIGFWYLFRGQASLPIRLLSAAVPFALFFGFFNLFEFDMDGHGRFVRLHWRGVENPDEKLEQLVAKNEYPSESKFTITESDYPGFLGLRYWPEVPQVNLSSDWEANPPKEIWRQPIGAGWSSFAIIGDRAYTQEQRGPNELVVCYQASTGEPLWTYSNETRFDPEGIIEAAGGHGTRATPTVVIDEKNNRGLVITHGATGNINCLDALKGNLVWSHNSVEEFHAVPLTWGNSSSPLVIKNDGAPTKVVIAIGAPAEVEPEAFDSTLIAFDLLTGEVIWKAGGRTTSYASPIFATLAGTQMVVQVNQNFVTGYSVEDGSVLWEHPWPGMSSGDANTTQPIPISENHILFSKGYGYGASLVEIKKTDDAFESNPVWSPPVKTIMKTKLSNLVIREGYAYALDAGILQCVEIATGKKQWKKRRRPAIGHGQLLIVGDQLLITTEHGELILAELNPEKYVELSSIEMLDDGEICWNNPAVVKDLLLMRNSVEAVAYRLPLSESIPSE